MLPPSALRGTKPSGARSYGVPCSSSARSSVIRQLSCQRLGAWLLGSFPAELNRMRRRLVKIGDMLLDVSSATQIRRNRP